MPIPLSLTKKTGATGIVLYTNFYAGFLLVAHELDRIVEQVGHHLQQPLTISATTGRLSGITSVTPRCSQGCLQQSCCFAGKIRKRDRDRRHPRLLPLLDKCQKGRDQVLQFFR